MKYALRITTVLIVLLLVADITPANAQIDIDSAARARRMNRPKPITKELSIGFRINTDGWSLFFDKGTVKGSSRESDKFYDINLWQIEFGEKKHPQETKRSNVNLATQSATPFIYGKINNFYTLKLGYGKRKMIAGKPDPGTVAIHWVYLGGLSLGLEKPYYYEAYVNGGSLEAVRFTDTTQYIFDQQVTDIAGKAGFTEGLNEIQFLPGVHFKTGLHFDFAASKKTKLAIETGVNVEVYSRAVQLMAFQDHAPYFVNAYLSIQAGKRWPEKKKSSRSRR